MSFTEPIIWSALPKWMQASPCEIVAALFGFVSVYLTIRNSVWLWPTGIVSVVAYAWLFRAVRLYPDMVLQLIFFALSVKGWLRWRDEADPDAAIRQLSSRQWGRGAACVAICYGAVGFFFARFTGSAMPWADGAILVLSLFAQLLLTFHFRENWYLWIAVDVIALFVYSATQLYLSLLLYALFLGMAIAGCVAWHRRSPIRVSQQ